MSMSNRACIQKRWNKKEQQYEPTMVYYNIGDAFFALGEPETFSYRMAESMKSFVAAADLKDRPKVIAEIFDSHREPQVGYGFESDIMNYDGKNKKTVDEMYNMLAAKIAEKNKS
jgi:hypothetical protein